MGLAEFLRLKSVDTSKSLMDIYEGAPFPHCDQLVLHAPGKCEYCDHYPILQTVRANNGIPFSGEGGSPDEERRPREIIDRWAGNRAKPKTYTPREFPRT